MQKITLIGNLVRDPSTKDVNGNPVCSFTLAVNSRQGGEEKATYYNVDAWGKTGELCARFLKKGGKCCVVGELEAREYTGRDGKVRVGLSVRHADAIEFLSPVSAGNSVPNAPAAPAAYAKRPQAAPQPIEEDDDELPF